MEAEDTSDQLDKFAKWVQEHNDYADDKDPKHVDVAILLSRFVAMLILGEEVGATAFSFLLSTFPCWQIFSLQIYLNAIRVYDWHVSFLKKELEEEEEGNHSNILNI